jgi:TPR repeat protein
MPKQIFHKRGSCFGIWFCAALVVAGGCFPFQSLAQTQNPDDEIETLKKLSREDLLQLAQKGGALPMYYFGLREWEQAHEEGRAAFGWSSLSTRGHENLPDAEERRAEEKWAKSLEADLATAAKSGDRGAAWALGRRGSENARRHGLEGFEWMKKAANSGLASAQFEVGIRYLALVSWVIVPFNSQEGLRYLQMAADQNVERAQHKIADLCLEGKIVPRDLNRGIVYLQKAVDQKCPRAQYELALQYANGNGEPRDSGESILALLRLSADQTNHFAMVELGHRYRLGLGVEKDIRKARGLYQRAAAIDENMNFENQSGIGAFLEVWKEE